jgi:hypothetical protein
MTTEAGQEKKAVWPVAELLLRQPEVGAAGEQGLDQRVEGLPFLLSDADQVRVELGEDSDLGLAARFGHGGNSNACATMAKSNKQGSRRANAQPSYSRRCIR